MLILSYLYTSTTVLNKIVAQDFYFKRSSKFLYNFYGVDCFKSIFNFERLKKKTANQS